LELLPDKQPWQIPVFRGGYGAGFHRTFDVIANTKCDCERKAIWHQGSVSRLRYLDSGIKSQKFKLAGAFAGDGISKYLIFFTDYDIVAAATADATHQMREFSDVNARSLPLSGLTLVNVQLHACGDFPVRRLQRHFTGQDLHLVRVDPPIGIRGRHRARKYLRKRGGGPATG
jgi:hypothetical protein